MSIREVYAKELLLSDSDGRPPTRSGTLAEEILRQAFRSVEAAALSSGAAGRYQHLDTAVNAAPSTADKQTQMEEVADNVASGSRNPTKPSFIDTRDEGVTAAPSLTDARTQTELVTPATEVASDERLR